MGRHLNILEYALASLWRRRYKQGAIVVVYAFTIAVLASVLFLTQGLKDEASRLLAGSPSLVVQRLVAGRHDLIPTAYADPIRKIPGVGTVTPRHWGYYYDPLTEANYTLLGVESGLPELQMLTGRLPAGPGECALGAGVAEVRRVQQGDDLILVDSRNTGLLFEIVGIFRSESNLLTHDLLVLGRDDLLDFFSLPPEQATDLAVEVYNEAEIATVAAKIRQRLPDTRPISRSEIARTYEAVLDWRSGMLLTLFASALVAFCILAWDKATGLSAEERREIGILKAIGWDTGNVLELRFWEGLAISITAFLLGLIAAWVHVFYFGAAGLAPILKGWSVLFPAFRLTPRLDFYQVSVMAFLTVLPYVVSTIVPSWKAAVTDPETVMRG